MVFDENRVCCFSRSLLVSVCWQVVLSTKVSFPLDGLFLGEGQVISVCGSSCNQVLLQGKLLRLRPLLNLSLAESYSGR